MAIPLKKHKHYDFNTKLKVILAKEQGMSYKEIQKKFKITSRQQIYNWFKYSKNNDSYRLHQKIGHRYKYQKNSEFYQQRKKKLETIQKEVQKEIKKRTKNNQIIINKSFYLEMIDKYRKEVPLQTLVKFFRIPSYFTYYSWLSKKKKKIPFLTNLDIKIRNICYQHRYYNNVGESFFVWGYRRVYHELLHQNIKVNPKTVYFKMKKMHLLCQTRKNRYLKRSSNNQNYVPLSQLNLLKNNFQADRPFQKLCADVTYLLYGRNPFLYLSAIMDLYNREIIAYTIADKQDLSLVMNTLEQLKPLKK
ncbi:IS3 family transposase, partial [Vaccinium witches'-broom phytoplasma]|uniref:IS3 family transposase n=1 Tax=Vaccinium witches'-broom phytoplasma TaxID=85642 RepID=UPI00036F78EC